MSNFSKKTSAKGRVLSKQGRINVGVAVVMIGLGVVVTVAAVVRGSPPARPAAPKAADYLTFCAGAAVLARGEYPRARGARYAIGADPVIINAGPPPVVFCPYVDRSDRPMGINIAVKCDDPIARECVEVRAVGG